MVQAWTCCRVQANTHILSVVQELVTTASTAMAENFGCIKKCSGLQRLATNPDYRCTQCMGNARPIEDRPLSEV